MPENNRDRPKHILIIRLSALGDVAMVVPVILGLRQQYPALKITLVSRPFFEPMFRGIPDLHFYPVDLKNKHKGVPGLYKLFKELSLLHIDAFADLHNVLRSKILGFFFKINGTPVITLDKGRADRKKLTSQKPKTIAPITSVFERAVDVFAHLNLPISLTRVDLLKKLELNPEITTVTGNKNCSWVGIAPFAAYATKMYPLDLMEKAIEKLGEEKLKIFLFGGGKEETQILDEIAVKNENCINLAGKISFEDELKVISNLSVMLGMDSGNGHLAAMYGVPVVTLWGNTHPFAGFKPFRQPEENSLTPDLTKYPLIPTSVYGKKIVPGYEDCMADISPDEVVRKVKFILEH